MNKLWMRLGLAFSLVALAGIGIAATLFNYQTDTGFRSYVMHSQIIDSGLVDRVAEHYAQRHGWSGIEAVFGISRGPRHGQNMNVALVAPSGQVIYAGMPGRMGHMGGVRTVSGDAIPVAVQGETVAYLVPAVPAAAVLTSQELAFLAQVNHSLLQAGLVAGALAIPLGILVARSLTAPLSHLTAAARRISRGELTQTVPVTGTEEVAALAHTFNDMAAALHRAEQTRRNLVADVAHELRTPLTVIQGNLRAILEDVYALDKNEVAAIYNETLTLKRLVDDLHELSRAEAGQLNLNIRPTHLQPILDETVDLFEDFAREQGIALTAELTPGLPTLRADPDRLRQILHNLLTNALRHTSSGGQVHIQAAPQGDVICISVSDTGEGIPSADLPHVFDRFWRADLSRSREHGGSGLGLAIVRQLVLAQGGQVDVESTPGTGSRFWFTLPTVPLPLVRDPAL